MTEFGLYIDDCGIDSTTIHEPRPFFGIGGVLINRADEEQIRESVDTFRQNWNITAPLHGTKIRSNKGAFGFLKICGTSEFQRFHDELLQLVIGGRMIVIACVVHRQGYFDRFFAEYGKERLWQMRRSACAIVIERAAKYVQTQAGKLKVFYEQGSGEDNRITEDTYLRLRKNGHPFNPETAGKYKPLSPEVLEVLLGGIERKTKENQIMQLADLCLQPVTVIKDGRDNRWYNAFEANRKLLDHVVDAEHVQTLGIKYYCF